MSVGIGIGRDKYLADRRGNGVGRARCAGLASILQNLVFQPGAAATSLVKIVVWAQRLSCKTWFVSRARHLCRSFLVSGFGIVHTQRLSGLKYLSPGPGVCLKKPGLSVRRSGFVIARGLGSGLGSRLSRKTWIVVRAQSICQSSSASRFKIGIRIGDAWGHSGFGSSVGVVRAQRQGRSGFDIFLRVGQAWRLGRPVSETILG